MWLEFIIHVVEILFVESVGRPSFECAWRKYTVERVVGEARVVCVWRVRRCAGNLESQRTGFWFSTSPEACDRDPRNLPL